MLKEVKNKRYKFEEQIKIYNNYKSKLSKEKKYKIINHLLAGEDFWGYFELVSTITYDLTENSDDFITLLENVYAKVKRDMAQEPFLNLLKDIGKNHREIALKIYAKIKDKSKHNDFKVVSGFILGGYSIKDGITLRKYLNKKIEYPLTNSILIAILVKYEKSKLQKEIYKYFDSVSKTQNKIILQEFTKVCLIFYKKNKNYFYNKILKLIKLKEKNITYLIFDRLTYQKILNQKQILEFIELSKDLDDFVIDKIVEVLRKFPKQHKQISDWFIYWLNKDLEFKLKNFYSVLEELVKKNKLFIKYFLMNYRKLQNKNYTRQIVLLQHLFIILSRFHKNYALKQLFKFNLKKKKEKYLFFKLNKVLIGNIYQDIKNKDVLISLIENLIKVSKGINFIEFNEKKYIHQKSKVPFLKEDYDYLIDFANNILSQLINRKQNYDFKLINKNLKKYNKIYKYAKEVIQDAEKKKQYTPLLWLGENEQSNFDDINFSKNDLERSIFWSQAYLRELNKGLRYLENKPNDKFKRKKDLVKNIKQNLLNENRFWDYLSELIFINKFDEKVIKVIEPIVPNKKDNNLDLKVHLFEKDIYFEITKPEIYRKLRLANETVGLKNRAFSTINKKYRQLFAKRTLDEIEKGKRNDLFFVAIDISNSVINEYQIQNSFLGSLSLTIQINKNTKTVVKEYPSRKKDSLYDKNKNTTIISGVIYFKKALFFVNNEPRIKLIGDIIINPNAKNILSEKEINKLKKIIFN